MITLLVVVLVGALILSLNETLLMWLMTRLDKKGDINRLKKDISYRDDQCPPDSKK